MSGMTALVVCILLCTGLLINAEPTIGSYMAFLRRLLFGPSDLKYSTRVIFDPNQGEVNRVDYQRAYGHQGQTLIAAYGRGLSQERLRALNYL